MADQWVNSADDEAWCGQPVEDPEGAEEILVARDAERGVGPASQHGGDSPREVMVGATVGQFMDALVPDLKNTVFIGGQWWHVKRVDLPGE